jgi:hypothetical protein
MIIFSLSIYGCNIFESKQNLEPIDSAIIFSVTYDSTNLIQNHSGFILLLKTEKIYGCSNFEVVSAVSINRDNISVQLFGIDGQELCETALGPATSRIPLDLKSGSFNLGINYKKKSDKYSLLINDLNVSVVEVDTSFTSYRKFNFDF